jgi:hypothetical protein
VAAGHLHAAIQCEHQLHGHLFVGRYKVLLVDDGVLGGCDYVHLNPELKASEAAIPLIC